MFNFILQSAIDLIYTHILKSIVYYHLEDMEETLSEFNQAYEMAHPDNIIMPFVENGRHLRRIIEYIRQDSHRKIPADWLEALQSKATTYAKRVSYLQQEVEKDIPGKSYKNILTDKEAAILQNLSLGLTREEIADAMDISPNTVKSTLRMIYTKLNAINGHHAIKIAMINGIIQ